VYEPYLTAVELKDPDAWDRSAFPFTVPAIAAFDGLDFTAPVTCLIGENGVGKSTLLEAIAAATGYNREGGSRNFNFATHEEPAPLSGLLRPIRGVRRPTDGFFFRADSFVNVITEIDRLGVGGSYGDGSLHERSHGEAFVTLVMERFRGTGLYLLDEPEAALSPTRQLAVLARIHDLVEANSQFIIATHSPILMSYPGADLVLIEDTGLRRISYDECEHVTVLREFLRDPERMVRRVLEG
jgi:predicted ATPase